MALLNGQSRPPKQKIPARRFSPKCFCRLPSMEARVTDGSSAQEFLAILFLPNSSWAGSVSATMMPSLRMLGAGNEIKTRAKPALRSDQGHLRSVFIVLGQEPFP